jgi:hypothetical protein
VACVTKNNDRECSERRYWAGPLKDTDRAALSDGVALDVVGDDEDNEIGDGEEGYNAGVFEGVEAAQERQWDDDKPDELAQSKRIEQVVLHESGDPELTVDEEGYVVCTGHKANDNAGHEIADDDEIADSHTEALDGDGGVEENRDVGVGELGEGGERDMAAVDVAGAASLQIEAEAGGHACPSDDEDAEEDTHLGEGRGHGEEASTED